MHARSFSIGALALAIASLSARVAAFHVESGTACSAVGDACSYVSNDSSTGGSKSNTVQGFCAPDLTCASNGATCTSDDQCFNYCGGGVCGGAGAGCNTQDAFELNQTGIACDSGYTCSSNGNPGTCEASSTKPKSNAVDAPVSNASAKARRTKRRIPEFEHRQVRADDIRAKFH